MYASRSSQKHSFVFKTVNVFVSLIFLLQFNTGLARAEGVTSSLFPGSDRGGGVRPGLSSSNMTSVELPLSLGYIREFHKAETDKPVIVYIQDAHCNYSCQKNIQSIVNFFNEKYDVNLAALEGGAGNYNFSIFTSIPDLDTREKIADYFVREGRVTGVELFAIMNPEKITVKGLERQELYEKNLSVYRESLSYKEYVEKYLQTLRHYVDNLKPPMYSDLIKDFSTHKASYDENKSHLKDYVQYLNAVSESNNINVANFKNFAQLMKLIADEKNIDFKKAEIEREDFIENLTKKLSKIEIAALVQKSIDFKNGNLPAADFYEYLFMKGKSCDMDIKPYPELIKYKAYLEQYDNVEKDVFFSEIFNIERYIVDNLTKKDDERKLYYLADDLGIMNKLFAVSLTRQQYDYYNQHKDDLSARNYIDFITQKASWYKMQANINPDVANLDGYKDKISNFYACSFERDNAFMDNINTYAQEKKPFFMVTGGFHTDNMKDLLKKAGYSYILITPKLDQEKGNPYFKLLSGNLSPIESMMTAANAALALRSPFSEMGIPAPMEQAVAELSAYINSSETEPALPVVVSTPLSVQLLTADQTQFANLPGSTVPCGILDGKQIYGHVIPVSDRGSEASIRAALEGLGVKQARIYIADRVDHTKLTLAGHDLGDAVRHWAMNDQENFRHEFMTGDRLDAILKTVDAGLRQPLGSLLRQLIARQNTLLSDGKTTFNGIAVVGQATGTGWSTAQTYSLDHASWRGLYITQGTDENMARSLVHELLAYYGMAPDDVETAVTNLFSATPDAAILASLQDANVLNAPETPENPIKNRDRANAGDQGQGGQGGEGAANGEGMGGKIVIENITPEEIAANPWITPLFNTLLEFYRGKRTNTYDICLVPHGKEADSAQEVAQGFEKKYDQRTGDYEGGIDIATYDAKDGESFKALFSEKMKTIKNRWAEGLRDDHYTIQVPEGELSKWARAELEILARDAAYKGIENNVHIVIMVMPKLDADYNVAGFIGLALSEHMAIRLEHQRDTLAAQGGEEDAVNALDKSIIDTRKREADLVRQIADLGVELTTDEQVIGFLQNLFKNSPGFTIKPLDISGNIQRHFKMQRQVAIAA